MVDIKWDAGMQYKKEYANLINELLDLTINYYIERLVTFAIFGSVAKDAFRPDSDIDILIVAEDLPDRRWKRTSEFIEHIEKKLDIQGLYDREVYPSLSPVIKSKEEINYGSPLFLDMTENVKILYDREDFFQHYLDTLRKKLSALGAKKIICGDSYYWDLKPDYKFGDVIEL